MLSVLIPVYNEAEILERNVQTVHQFLAEREIAHEIIVVSNGSSDATDTIGKTLVKSLSYFRFFSLPERGAGRAFVLAVKESRGESIVTLDVDLSSDLRFVEYATDLLQYADMVVGSKTMGNQRRGVVRVLGSQLYILFTQLLFDLVVSDYSIGSKAFRKEAIVDALPHLDSWTGYIFELCLYLRGKGRKIIQVGIDCDDRRPSRFNLLHEGVYRYSHLYRCFKLRKQPNSWLFVSR